MPVFRLSDQLVFPPPEMAEPDGLLAIGGDLSPERLLLAYSLGIFPWFGPGDPILWWSPSPRLIIEPAAFTIPKRLARLLRQQAFLVTMDQAFAQVITACAAIQRRQGPDTWITPEMVEAYSRLHSLGYAHSVECWREGELVGGLYGVVLGRIFFGESMFSRTTNSSKVALATLVNQLHRWEFELLDCQIKSDHLLQFRAREMSRQEFQKRLATNARHPTHRGKWDLSVA